MTGRAAGSADGTANGTTLWLARTTPFPNALLDRALPQLGDTAWRLLCVVVRQTRGWQASDSLPKGNQAGQRKVRDWLTHAQLKARTGRGSAAVCAAIEELVKRQLIEVQDEEGRTLSSAAERRRAGGRLYFRLHPHWDGDDEVNDSSGKPAKHGQSAAPATEPTQDAKLSPEITGLSFSEKGFSQNGKGFSLAAFRNPKTTKEKQTKENKEKENTLLFFSQSEKVGDAGEKRHSESETPLAPAIMAVGAETKLKSAIKAQAEEPYTTNGTNGTADESLQAFIASYQNLYRQHFPSQTVPTVEEEERRLLQRRLAQHGEAALLHWLPAFFACRFGYVRRRRYSLGSFLDSLHVLQAAQGAGQNARWMN